MKAIKRFRGRKQVGLPVQRCGEHFCDRQGHSRVISLGENAGKLCILQKTIWQEVSVEELVKRGLRYWFQLEGTGESDELNKGR